MTHKIKYYLRLAEKHGIEKIVTLLLEIINETSQGKARSRKDKE